MAVDFPNNPVDGQSFSSDGSIWIYEADPGCWRPASDGPSGDFVLKSGDTMSGILTMRKDEFPSIHFGRIEDSVRGIFFYHTDDDDMRVNNYATDGTFITDHRFSAGLPDDSSIVRRVDGDARYLQLTGGTVSGNVTMTGTVKTGATLQVEGTNTNLHLYFTYAGVNRGLLYYNKDTGNMQANSYNSSGTYTGASTFISDGTFKTGRIKGPSNWDGARIQSYQGANYMAMGWSNSNIIGAVDHAVEMVLGTTSDYRVKNETGELENALATISKLRPITYTLKDPVGFDLTMNDGPDPQDPNRVPLPDEHVGLIAHEVQEHIPSAVTSSKDNPDALQSVTYQLLVPHLIAAVKELTARIEELEGQTNG